MQCVIFYIRSCYHNIMGWLYTSFITTQNNYSSYRLCWKLSPKELWNGYDTHKSELYGNKYNKNKIGRNSFYYLVDHLTCSNKIIVQGVDYVQALLVAEPITVLQDIVDSLVHSSKKEMMKEYLTATASFLKYRYSQHVTVTTDDCVSHDLKYVLGRDSKVDNTAATLQKRAFTCNQCRFPFYTYHKIRTLMKDYNTSNQSTDIDSNAGPSIDVQEKKKKYNGDWQMWTKV